MKSIKIFNQVKEPVSSFLCDSSFDQLALHYKRTEEISNSLFVKEKKGQDPIFRYGEQTHLQLFTTNLMRYEDLAVVNEFSVANKDNGKIVGRCDAVIYQKNKFALYVEAKKFSFTPFEEDLLYLKDKNKYWQDIERFSEKFSQLDNYTYHDKEWFEGNNFHSLLIAFNSITISGNPREYLDTMRSWEDKEVDKDLQYFHYYIIPEALDRNPEFEGKKHILSIYGIVK